jgi:hypothetical protein
MCSGCAGDSVSVVRPDRYKEVNSLAREVRELLLERDPKDFGLKPNSYEPTVAQSVALALLELDRIASEPRSRLEALPTFVSDFLNRHLSKRLLDRYSAADLPSEFDRRLTDVLRGLASSPLAGRDGAVLDRIHRLLCDLESALLLRQVPADRNPER